MDVDPTGGAGAAAAMAVISTVFLFFLIFFIGALAAVIIPLWRIMKRMGFHPAWSFFILIPFGSLIGLYLVAFSDWPVEKGGRTLPPKV